MVSPRFPIASIRIDVNRDVRIPIKLEIASAHSEVSVVATAALDMGSAVGNVVSSREATDLPLNGRNFTQLGLLQPGVAPMTSGLLEAGGIVRSQQAYGVNGQAPESNNYLLDGMTNVDSVNGAFAIRTPVDAISEFRVLTLNAPAEYGQTAGATTTVVTKSGSNNFHGDLYEFIRNDAFDARNFFAVTTEPLHQNQFGATIGGPIRKNKDFFFAYYEGYRNVQGETQAAIVPTAAQRTGDFSGLVDPNTGQPVPLINEFTGQQFPNNQIPSFLLNPIALNAEKLIPLPNIGTNVYSTTQNLTQNYNQGGARYDHYFDNGDRLFGRYAGSSLNTHGSACRSMARACPASLSRIASLPTPPPFPKCTRFRPRRFRPCSFPSSAMSSSMDKPPTIRREVRWGSSISRRWPPTPARPT